MDNNKRMEQLRLISDLFDWVEEEINQIVPSSLQDQILQERLSWDTHMISLRLWGLSPRGPEVFKTTKE